jgi:hypothetical protein
MILETTTDVPAPLTAVLEVSGAVLSWVVDDPAAPAAITFTDLTRADWLWRLVGESAHAALLSGQPLTGALTLAAEPAAALRRLALGHWLRRWWPASRHDGIVALDPALLDAEIAVLTAAADGFFTDDTLDSDVAALLAPHAVGLAVAALSGDPRVADLPTTPGWTAGRTPSPVVSPTPPRPRAGTITRWPPGRPRPAATG